MRMGSNMKNIILSQAINHTLDDGSILNLKAGANQVDDEVAEHWFVQHYIVDVPIHAESDSKAVKQVQSLEAVIEQMKVENESLVKQVQSLEAQLVEAKATASPETKAKS